MSEWQPIETAPQDGKTKLILGAWDPRDPSRYNTVMVCALEPLDSTEGDTSRPRATFWTSVIFYPTHWMPLPEPPQ